MDFSLVVWLILALGVAGCMGFLAGGITASGKRGDTYGD